MAGFNEKQLRQLQTMMQMQLQPQAASITALSEAMSKMNTVLAQEMEAVNEKISNMQEDFERRVKMLEGRSANTSPPRKSSRVDDGDADMGSTKPTSRARSSTPIPTRGETTPRRVSFGRGSSAPADSSRNNKDQERVVIIKLPELSTSRSVREWWVSLLGRMPSDTPRLTGSASWISTTTSLQVSAPATTRFSRFSSTKE